MGQLRTHLSISAWVQILELARIKVKFDSNENSGFIQRSGWKL